MAAERSRKLAGDWWWDCVAVYPTVPGKSINFNQLVAKFMDSSPLDLPDADPRCRRDIETITRLYIERGVPVVQIAHHAIGPKFRGTVWIAHHLFAHEIVPDGLLGTLADAIRLRSLA
jgi:hypothetical protein